MWLSMSAASLEMRAASSRTICLRSVRGRRSSPWATPRSPAAFSRAVAARSVRLAACASRLSFRREAAAIARRSTVVCPIASPVLAPLSGRTAHRRRETNEARDGCPRSPVVRRPAKSNQNSRRSTLLHPRRLPLRSPSSTGTRPVPRRLGGKPALRPERTVRPREPLVFVDRPDPPGGVNRGIAADPGPPAPVRTDTQATNHT